MYYFLPYLHIPATFNFYNYDSERSGCRFKFMGPCTYLNFIVSEKEEGKKPTHTNLCVIVVCSNVFLFYFSFSFICSVFTMLTHSGCAYLADTECMAKMMDCLGGKTSCFYFFDVLFIILIVGRSLIIPAIWVPSQACARLGLRRVFQSILSNLKSRMFMAAEIWAGRVCYAHLRHPKHPQPQKYSA